MMRRVIVHPLKEGHLTRLVAFAWALLACALAAEFSGVWTRPRCYGREAGAAPAWVAAAAPAVAVSGAPAAGLGSNDTAGSSGNSTAADARREATWQEIDALISQPAGLYGRQAKPQGAVPANMSLLLLHMTNHNAEQHGVPAVMGPALFRWFAFAHTFNKTAGQSSADLQSPVPSCHFYVDHRYRILYIRNTKTAGTSIASTLGMKENPLACRDPKWCYAKCQGRLVCMEYLWDVEQLRKAFSEYTVFTFVRNPWARAISSFLHIHKYGMRDRCQDPFPKFAELPSAYGAKCLVNQGGCCNKRFGWILEHVEPQSQCMFTAEGRPVLDFIGRVEHLDEDMQELLELINRRRPMGTEPLAAKALPRLMVGGSSLASKEDERRRKYAELYMHNDALADIRCYYHSDFSLLQFNHSQSWEDSSTVSSGSGSPSEDTHNGTAGGTSSSSNTVDQLQEVALPGL